MLVVFNKPNLRYNIWTTFSFHWCLRNNKKKESFLLFFKFLLHSQLFHLKWLLKWWCSGVRPSIKYLGIILLSLKSTNSVLNKRTYNLLGWRSTFLCYLANHSTLKYTSKPGQNSKYYFILISYLFHKNYLINNAFWNLL